MKKKNGEGPVRHQRRKGRKLKEVIPMDESKKRSAFERLKALINSNIEREDDVIIHYSVKKSSKSMSNTDINLLMSNT